MRNIILILLITCNVGAQTKWDKPVKFNDTVYFKVPLRFKPSSSVRGSFYGTDYSSNAFVWNYENKYISFGTNDIERLRINANGNINAITDTLNVTGGIVADFLNINTLMLGRYATDTVESVTTGTVEFIDPLKIVTTGLTPSPKMINVTSGGADSTVYIRNNGVAGLGIYNIAYNGLAIDNYGNTGIYSGTGLSITNRATSNNNVGFLMTNYGGTNGMVFNQYGSANGALFQNYATGNLIKLDNFYKGSTSYSLQNINNSGAWYGQYILNDSSGIGSYVYNKLKMGITSGNGYYCHNEQNAGYYSLNYGASGIEVNNISGTQGIYVHGAGTLMLVEPTSSSAIGLKIDLPNSHDANAITIYNRYSAEDIFHIENVAASTYTKLLNITDSANRPIFYVKNDTSVFTNKMKLGDIGVTLPITEGNFITQLSGANNAISAVSYGGSSGFRSGASGGTIVSPTQTLGNTIIAFLGGHGYDGSNWTSASKGLISIKSDDNFTPSAQGTKITFETTTKLTTTRVERMVIKDTILIKVPIKATNQPSDLGKYNVTINSSTGELYAQELAHAFYGFADSSRSMSLSSNATWYHVTNPAKNLWINYEDDYVSKNGDTIILGQAAHWEFHYHVVFTGSTGVWFKARLYNVTKAQVIPIPTAATAEGANYTSIGNTAYCTNCDSGDKILLQMIAESNSQTITLIDGSVLVKATHGTK